MVEALDSLQIPSRRQALVRDGESTLRRGLDSSEKAGRTDGAVRSSDIGNPDVGLRSPRVDPEEHVQEGECSRSPGDAPRRAGVHPEIGLNGRCDIDPHFS